MYTQFQASVSFCLLITSSWSLSEIHNDQLIIKDIMNVPIFNQSTNTHTRRLLQSTILFDSTSDPIPSAKNARMSLFVHDNAYTELAADFTAETPSDCGWSISTVSVHGAYIPNGSYVGIGTWTVRIYNDDLSGEGPGALLTERIVSNFSEQFRVHAPTDVAITLCISPVINVPQGHYWLSVQINNAGGYFWFWFLTTNQRDQEYYQRRTGLDGFGFYGCDIDWGRGFNDCGGPENALDVLFSIEGEIRPCTDNPTSDPTSNPTPIPTPIPSITTWFPTVSPTNNPTSEPTSNPTSFPTSQPTRYPTVFPTID
eukprot:840935_1